MEPWGTISAGEQNKNTVPEQNDNSAWDTVPPSTVSASASANAPIVLKEVTTTRTIHVNEDADLADPNVAQLVAQFKTQPLLSPGQASSDHVSLASAALGAHYLPPLPAREDDVYYISEEEGKDPNIPHRHKTTKHSGGPSHSSKSKNGGWSPPRSSSPSASSKPKPKSVYKSSEDLLKPLGSFSEMDITSEVGKMIKTYAKNSLNAKRGSGMKLEVRGIYKKEGGILSGLLPGGSVTKSEHKGKKKSHKTNDYKMLLWFKTSPNSIKALASGKDSCTAFYDRLSRALPKPVDDLKDHWRQIVLLCKVSLGNVYKSPHGYSHWHKSSHPPRGSDSVKGFGKFKPNWARNVEYKSTIVPVGETEKSTRKCEIDYNEYIVFHESQIKVKYAVDIELVTRKDSKEQH